MNVMLDLAEIRRTADELDALLGGDDERLFHDMVTGETDIDRVASRIWEQVARDSEMLVGIGERKAALDERKRRVEARRDAGKAFLGKLLRAARLPKLELPEVTISVRDGRPSLKVVDPDAVPADLCRTKTEPDKAAINEKFADEAALPNWLVREAARDVVVVRTR